MDTIKTGMKFSKGTNIVPLAYSQKCKLSPAVGKQEISSFCITFLHCEREALPFALFHPHILAYFAATQRFLKMERFLKG